jgi:hypothetical protein
VDKNKESKVKNRQTVKAAFSILSA